MKTCPHNIKCEHCVEKHFCEKCHIILNNKKIKCVLCENKYKTWFNICVKKKKKH